MKRNIWLRFRQPARTGPFWPLLKIHAQKKFENIVEFCSKRYSWIKLPKAHNWGGMKSVVKIENIIPKFIQIKYIQHASGILYFPRIPLYWEIKIKLFPINIWILINEPYIWIYLSSVHKKSIDVNWTWLCKFYL